MSYQVLGFLALAAAVAALPTDQVLMKPDPEGLRYQYIKDDEGNAHLVDSWIKLSDVKTPRYNPDTDNEYHLYTRRNPMVSQPLIEGNTAILEASNFDPAKRTVVLIHGFLGNILSGFNTVLVPAFLFAGDVNVIVVDWGAGAHFGFNGISCGRSVGRVINWITTTSGGRLSDFHVVGYSVGAHAAGIAGRTVFGQVGYVTALDPADRWLSSQMVRPSDAIYTEVIHTNIGNIGMEEPAGDVDFYPNGGIGQPGCATALCDHYRSYFFLGESLMTGKFIGRKCDNYQEAISHSCTGTDTLEMGGLIPKYGATGVYYLQTNASPPFARG